MSKKILLTTHPRKFGNHVTVHRKTTRPIVLPHHWHTNVVEKYKKANWSWRSKQKDKTKQYIFQQTLTLSRYFGSPGENWLHINVVINWQLSKQSIRWPVSPDRIAGSGVDPSRSSTFLKLSADKLLVFRWSQAQVYFLKFIWNTLCLCHYGPALLTFWFQTDLGRKNSASYLKMQAGKTDAFHFSHHSHVLVTLHVQFLCPDWSKFDRWVHAENSYNILKLGCFDSWSWQSFVSTCDVFNCLFPLDVQNEIQSLPGVFCYSWLVSLLKFLLVKIGNPISDRIVFVFHLAGCVREF